MMSDRVLNAALRAGAAFMVKTGDMPLDKASRFSGALGVQFWVCLKHGATPEDVGRAYGKPAALVLQTAALTDVIAQRFPDYLDWVRPHLEQLDEFAAGDRVLQ